MRTDAVPDLTELSTAHRHVQQADEAARRARHRRNQLLAELREAGVPVSRLAEVTGVSRRGLYKAIGETE